MSNIESKQRIKRRRVTFMLSSEEAEEVVLLGDFNNWNPEKHPMKRGDNGVWQKTVMLYPGSYQYKFLVDGHWQGDPQNVMTCPNCFGTRNNLLTVEKK